MARVKYSLNNQTLEDYNKNVELNNYDSLRVLIFNESFYPYTSGISRRFIEIIKRLANKNFKIHLVTGTRVCLFFFYIIFLIIDNVYSESGWLDRRK
jgi:hypothetical protein